LASRLQVHLVCGIFLLPDLVGITDGITGGVVTMPTAVIALFVVPFI
jgi:hypothetical protein